MNTVIILTLTSRHKPFFGETVDKQTHIVYPQKIEDLYGLKPCAIISTEDWWKNKSSEFCSQVDYLRKSIKI